MDTHSPESRTYDKILAEHQELKHLLKKIERGDGGQIRYDR